MLAPGYVSHWLTIAQNKPQHLSLFLLMHTVPYVFRGDLHLLASTASKPTWYWDKILCAHKEDLCSLQNTNRKSKIWFTFLQMDGKKQLKMERKDKRQMLTLGCLWFRTMANSRPSGEKAGTKDPLDFTGWQGGVRRDMGYVFVAHFMLYPTGLQKEMWLLTIVKHYGSSFCYVDLLTHSTFTWHSSHWIFRQVMISFFPDVKTNADKQASPIT